MGPRLRQLRLKRDESLATVAEAVDVSVGFLSNLERSQSGASVGIMRRLAQYYGLNSKTYPVAVRQVTDSTVPAATLTAVPESSVCGTRPQVYLRSDRRTSTPRFAPIAQPITTRANGIAVAGSGTSLGRGVNVDKMLFDSGLPLASKNCITSLTLRAAFPLTSPVRSTEN